MLKRKDIVTSLLSSILTCGIYSIVWFVNMNDDLNELDTYSKEQHMSGIKVWLLTLLTCGIYGIYWAYKTGERIDRMKSERNMTTSNNSAMIYMALYILSYFTGLSGLVVYALLQDEINGLIDKRDND